MYPGKVLISVLTCAVTHAPSEELGETTHTLKVVVHGYNAAVAETQT